MSVTTDANAPKQVFLTMFMFASFLVRFSAFLDEIASGNPEYTCKSGHRGWPERLTLSYGTDCAAIGPKGNSPARRSASFLRLRLSVGGSPGRLEVSSMAIFTAVAKAP
jgi:hypothetical protein